MQPMLRTSRLVMLAVLLLGFSTAGQAQENLLANPGFESDLSGWGKYPGRIGNWSSEDADGSGSSGSALLGNEGTSDGVVPLVLNQCIEVEAGEQYLFGGNIRVPAGQPSGTAGYIFAYPYTNSSCAGDLGIFQNTTAGSGGTWGTASSSITPGVGVQAILIAAGVFKPNGETADAEAYFDNIYLEGPDGGGGGGGGGDDFEVNPAMSASWFNPAESGHGIMIHLLSANSAWMCWFTFDLSGNPAWICALGSVSGDTITFANAFQVEGGAFPPNYDPDMIQEVPWGSIEIVFTGCNAGTMTWTTSAAGFTSGSMPLSRLTDLWSVPCS